MFGDIAQVVRCSVCRLLLGDYDDVARALRCSDNVLFDDYALAVLHAAHDDLCDVSCFAVSHE